MSAPRNEGPSTRTRIILGGLLAVVVAYVAYGVIFGHAKPAAQPVSSSGDPYMNLQWTPEPDQSLAVVDGFTWGNVPNSIADAIRYCSASSANGTSDIKDYQPCLNGIAVYDLKGNTLTTVQTFPGYTMSVNTSGAPQYSVGNDTLFAAAVRSKHDGGSWSAWQYTSDPSTNDENGGYQAGSEYQIALFGYDQAHEAHSNPAAKLPQGFDWSAFIPQFLGSKN